MRPISRQVWAELAAAFRPAPDPGLPLLCRVFGHDVDAWPAPLNPSAYVPATTVCRDCGTETTRRGR